jgi:hypothetical protein
MAKESLEEFHALVERLWEYYEPVGVVEEMLAQTIATCLWRKARVIRAENGEIRKRLDTLSMDRALRNSDKVNLDLALSAMERGLYRAENQSDQKVSTRDRYAAMQVAEKNLWEHRFGLEYLRVLLEMAKFEIASNGYMSEKIRQKILFAFCFSDYPFAVTCSSAGPPEAKVEDGSSEKGTDIETEKERADFVIACIDFQLKKISEFKEYALGHENLALEL